MAKTFAIIGFQGIWIKKLWQQNYKKKEKNA